MPTFERAGAVIHYDVEGVDSGDPVLLIAPGGMRSANEFWTRMPWNPRSALSQGYRLIGMDQRNAGRSTAPVSRSDGWSTYRDDQLGLLDHLDVERCHVLGMCIGGPFVVALLLAAPERFTSAVLLQPAGVNDENRGTFHGNFDEWAAPQMASHPEASPDDWSAFNANMWDGEFVLTATPDQIATIEVPMLVMMGDDFFHPSDVSRQIAAAAPNATLVERWKDDESLPATDRTIKDFLAARDR